MYVYTIFFADLRQEISVLCSSLGKDWKFFMRALGVSDDDIENVCSDYRQMREKIHQTLLIWQQDQQQSASRAKLVEACRHQSVKRLDLAQKLESL